MDGILTFHVERQNDDALVVIADDRARRTNPARSSLDRSGQHPKHKGLFIFNGLGTKGTSLGPYFAQMMAEHLVDGTELMPDVSISRHPFPS